MDNNARSTAHTWPVKIRELQSHPFDSTMWEGVRFRDDDIVIATYAMSGTSWMQQIVGQLIFDGAENTPTAGISPWVACASRRARSSCPKSRRRSTAGS